MAEGKSFRREITRRVRTDEAKTQEIQGPGKGFWFKAGRKKRRRHIGQALFLLAA